MSENIININYAALNVIQIEKNTSYELNKIGLLLLIPLQVFLGHSDILKRSCTCHFVLQRKNVNRKVQWFIGSWSNLNSLNGVVLSLRLWAGSRVRFQIRPFSIPNRAASSQSPQSLELSRQTMSVADINERSPHYTPPGNFHGLSTPLWKVTDPARLLFTNDTSLLCVGGAHSSSGDMANIYRLYVGILTGETCCHDFLPHQFCNQCKQNV